VLAGRRTHRLQQVGLATARRPAQPGKAAAVGAGDLLQVIDRLQVAAAEEACEDGAIGQPHA
jgi:hypothetical protein